MDGSLGIRKISDGSGDKVQFILKDQAATKLTSDGVLKLTKPKRLEDQR